MGSGDREEIATTEPVGNASRPAARQHNDGSSAEAPVVGDGRYEDRGQIGLGGMGEVRRVFDRKLARPLAMKILRRRHFHDEVMHERFQEEAQVTAGLQHPGIVSVHDMGKLPDGRLWFTMDEVQGRTLASLLEDSDPSAGTDEPELRNLIDILGRACSAIQYAHERGVLHRDLKPDNIMVGPFRDVMVVDWGIAKRLSEPWRIGDDGAPPTVGDVDRDTATVVGTLPYMAPEQLVRDVAPVGRHTDVYALGAILFELLTGQPPFGREHHRIMSGLVNGDQPRVFDVDGVSDRLPQELVELAERALSPNPGDRPVSVGVVGESLRAWLDGVARKARAEQLVASVWDFPSRFARRQQEAARLGRRADDILDGLDLLAPVDDKLEAWTLEDQADEIRQALISEEAEYEQTLHTALLIAPDLDDARAALTDLYRRRVAEAEARGDRSAAAADLVRVRAYDRGRHTRWLRGLGRLSLASDPPGAVATLHSFSVERRRLVTSGALDLGVTPLREVEIQRGSHLVRLRWPDGSQLDYPIHIGRGEHWDCIAPGDDHATEVCRPSVSLSQAECFVPGGWFRSGGDPAALDGLPSRRIWVDSLVCMRDPVTNAEYLRFLNDLVAKGRDDEALRHAPRLHGAGEARLAYRRADDGTFGVDPTAPGAGWDVGHPVVRIGWDDAMAYAAWAAAVSGLPWRLPHDLEWEKAARGVDGRTWPWGDYADPTWYCGIRFHQGMPGRVTAKSCPHDESPYGVRGMAGNVRDWCLNGYRRAGSTLGGERLVAGNGEGASPLRMVRGGSWNSVESFCRPASRFASAPWERHGALGFRLVRPIARPGGAERP